MAPLSKKIGATLSDVLVTFVDIILFWLRRLLSYINTPTPKQLLLETLENARVYEEWEAAAQQLDELVKNDVWRRTPTTRDYDSQLIFKRANDLADSIQVGDVMALCRTMRSGLVRNLGNITSAKLYNRAYAGTKDYIEMYIEQCVETVRYVTAYRSDSEHDLTDQNKLDLLHDARQAFGRSCLVLQGGSIFGLCHLGVVKALHEQALLPRIIAGTATGALMAALVGVHTEDELPTFLRSEGINLQAFAASSRRAVEAHHGDVQSNGGWLSTLVRRARRFMKYGYVLDVKVLEECVRANVGDLTFEEAYHRTKRVLNITVSSNGGGVPGLLNYLTAPNVLIWSAALASNATDARFSPTMLQCKTSEGIVEPWDAPAEASQTAKPTFKTKLTNRHTPLSRVAELFNVNHFIISQARPYIAPFLAPSLYHSNSARSSREPWSAFFVRLLSMELQHRLNQMNQLGLLSPGIRRLLIDETVPGASWTLVPKVSISDFARLLRNPTPKEIDYWILRGERSVWPAVTALKIRCLVEVELDRGYQSVRRKKPFDRESQLGTLGQSGQVVERRAMRTQRAASMGAASLGATSMGAG
ncbi:triacylglycerol lipase [Elasticomyces elasticus]|nr:triacylglycerol lipase [Elasticomyces elasticus]KAK3636213.1 triacylglycerol lipase [Elasticomyces elasticus]KAK5762692.1 triacylglycerol lipase [Elasticomyces elasticus]